MNTPKFPLFRMSKKAIIGGIIKFICFILTQTTSHVKLLSVNPRHDSMPVKRSG